MNVNFIKAKEKEIEISRLKKKKKLASKHALKKLSVKLQGS